MDDDELSASNGRRGSNSPMDDEEFQSVVANALKSAIDYAEHDIAPKRADAIERYLGQPYGDERDGRSKVVSTEVRDTINAIMPSLLRIFASAERAVEFVPHGPEDTEVAEQATDYVNWIYNSDNPGFQILETWMMDGLLSKVGVVKFWWDEREEISAQCFSGLSPDAIMALRSDPSVEIEELELDPQNGTISCEARRRTVTKRVRIEAVPPEEFLIDRNARTLDDATLVAHRRVVTVSDLVALGYDWDTVLGLADGSDLDTTGERLARRRTDDSGDDVSSDPSQRRVTYTECFLRVDRDGDGIAELRRVCTGGTGHEVLHDEPCDEIPFAAWCPVPLPHVFYGLSIADMVSDIQRIKTVILRNMLDSLALSIHPRVAIVEGQVNLDDVLNDEVGAVIRQRVTGAYQPMAVPFVGQAAFPMLEYLDTLREERTGITRASQGLDADALQSTTRAAVTATISAAQGKIELLARIFAETGLKTLFRGILRLICRHQDAPRMVRLRNRWTPVDPRSWDAGMDLSVNVGLGRGTDDDRLAALSQIKATQEAIIQRYGPNNPLVSVAQYRHTLAKMLEIGGYKDADQFFQDPSSQPPQQPQQPPPDPKMIESQARMQESQQRLQIERERAAADIALERERMTAELQIERERSQMEHQRKIDQMRAEFDLRRAQMQAEAQLSAANAALRGGAGSADIGSPVRMGGDVG